MFVVNLKQTLPTDVEGPAWNDAFRDRAPNLNPQLMEGAVGRCTESDAPDAEENMLTPVSVCYRRCAWLKAMPCCRQLVPAGTPAGLGSRITEFSSNLVQLNDPPPFQLPERQVMCSSLWAGSVHGAAGYNRQSWAAWESVWFEWAGNLRLLNQPAQQGAMLRWPHPSKAWLKCH